MRASANLKRWLGGVGGVGWWVGRHCSMARGGFHDLLLMSRLLRSPSEACALSHLGVVIHYGITKECHFRMKIPILASTFPHRRHHLPASCA